MPNTYPDPGPGLHQISITNTFARNVIAGPLKLASG